MIKSFRCKDTAAFFDDRRENRFQAIERQTRRKLLYLNRACTPHDLMQPPGNTGEALKGDRSGQYGIRINDQWRICEIINDKWSVSADTALGLGKYCSVSPESWLNLQVDYDMRVARRTTWTGVEPRVRVRAA